MNKILKNWSYLLMSDISQAVISFFVFMLMARKLTPEGYGILNAIMALASLFAVISNNFSANQVITREVTLHSNSTRSIVNLVWPIRLFSLLLTLWLLIVYEFWIGETKFIIIFSIIVLVIANTIWDLAESIAFGHFVTKITTYLNVCFSSLWLIIVIFLPKDFITVNLIVIIISSIFMARGILYILLCNKKFLKNNIKEINLKAKEIITMSIPYLWMRGLGTFSEQIPILLLKHFSGSAQVGIYSVGNRFVLPITLAIGTGLRAIFPFMTKMYNEDKNRFNIKLNDGFIFVIIFGSTFAAVLTLSSSWWLPTIFGEAYSSSINAFNYQAWFGVLLSFDLLLGTVLSSTYRQKILAIITTIDIGIMFPILLIGTKYGANGLAIARLIGVVVTVVIHIFIIIKVLEINISSVEFYLSCIYFLGMMSISVFLNSSLTKILLFFLLFFLILISPGSPIIKLQKEIYGLYKKRITK